MHRLLDHLDRSFSTIVPIAYLAGMLASTAFYLTDGKWGALSFASVITIGLIISTATEVHSFLQQRRVRILGAQVHEARDDEVREELRQQLRRARWVLAALMAFQIFTSVGYVATTWHPTAGLLPQQLDILVRGCVLPAFFFLAGSLTPINESPAAVLAHATTSILHQGVAASVHQWRKQIKAAKRRNRDLSPLMIELLENRGNLEAAQLVGILARHIAPAGGHVNVVPAVPTHQAPSGHYDQLPRGSQEADPRQERPEATPPQVIRPNVLRLAPARTRADAGMSAEQRKELARRRLAAARKILDANPRASLREIARGVAIATKHRCNTDRARELKQWIIDHQAASLTATGEEPEQRIAAAQ